MATFLGAVLLLGVIGFVPEAQIPIRSGKQALVDLGLVFGLGFLLPSRWLKLFYWWSLLVLCKRFTPHSLLVFYTLSIYLFVFSFAVRKVTEDHLNLIARWIRGITIFQLLWMGLQFFNMDPIFVDVMPPGMDPQYWDPTRPTITGFLDNSMLAGSYLAVVSPFFLQGRWKWFLPVVLGGILMAGSEGAFLTAILILAWTCWRMFRLSEKLKTLMMYGTIFICTGVLYYEWAHWLVVQENSRFFIWEKTKDLIMLDKFMLWTGWGGGQFSVAFPGLVRHWEIAPSHLSWTHTHNDFLQLWFEAGLIGLVLACGFIVQTLRPALRRMDPICTAWTGSLLGWLLIAVWSFPAQTAGLNVVGLILWIGVFVLGKGECHACNSSQGQRGAPLEDS